MNTIIIGASAAGLATAACLKKKGIPFLILEQHGHVANAWRNHYDRLHLHTSKIYSSLPYFPFPKSSPTYIPKNEVIKYLEDYAAALKINPLFNQQVVSVEQSQQQWLVRTQANSFSAKHVVIATGYNMIPYTPEWKGMELFKGRILHSSSYKNGSSYTGQKVLVIGFGNSACEISICLHEHGAFPSMSVKGGVNIIPRDTGGKFTSWFLQSMSWLVKRKPALIDFLNGPFLRWRMGDYTKYGLKKLPYGPLQQIVKYKRIPVLDIGTLDLIKNGDIKIFPGIKCLTNDGVVFSDDREYPFDTVIAATGYRPSVAGILPKASKLIDEEGRPLITGVESPLSNIYFCGFSLSPSGMLREIGFEAKRIANLIDKKNKIFTPGDLTKLPSENAEVFAFDKQDR